MKNRSSKEDKGPLSEEEEKHTVNKPDPTFLFWEKYLNEDSIYFSTSMSTTFDDVKF